MVGGIVIRAARVVGDVLQGESQKGSRWISFSVVGPGLRDPVPVTWFPRSDELVTVSSEDIISARVRSLQRGQYSKLVVTDVRILRRGESWSEIMDALPSEFSSEAVDVETGEILA